MLGGLACLAGVAVAIAAGAGLFGMRPEARDQSLFAALALGSCGFLAIGLWDDRRSLSAATKAALQGVLLLGAVAVWRPTAPWAGVGGAAAAWAIMMLLVNAWNYLDHADGLLATHGAIAAAVLAVSTAAAGGAGSAAHATLWALAGAFLGFLAWNRPVASIFLGDAGSLPLAFIAVLCSLALLSRDRAAAIPAAISAHALVLADFVLVTAARLARKRNPFIGGREHTGHRLFTAIGPWPALAVLALCDAAIGCAALWFGPPAPVATAFAVSLVIPLGALAASRLPPPPAGSDPQVH